MPKPAPAKNVAEFLSSAPEDAKAALLKLRKSILAAVPGASERVSYGLWCFDLDGLLVGFAAFPNHCGFYVMSTGVMRAFAEELQGYDTGKGCIRFPATKPLPAALVRKLVKARILENESRKKGSKSRTAAPPRSTSRSKT